MKIQKIQNTSIDSVVKTLESGGLVIMPTETVYGAFVDATNKKAIEKLTKFKSRPFGKPYSVAVADQEMASKYVFLNKTAKRLYKNFLPGPLTIISKGKHKVAEGVESESGTLGIRIPNHKFILDVVRKFNKPITATSANPSYKKRPYSVNDILNNISSRQRKCIDLIIDAGELPKNEPSTVIDTTSEDLTILRQGDIKFSRKNEVLSRSPENTQNIAKEIWQKYEQYLGSRSIVFALEGEMGSGKTIFTKGLAKAVGIKETITSPTYDLEHIYHINKKRVFAHIDTWRMQDPEELDDLGFDKRILDKSIIVLEWADKVHSKIRKYAEDALVIWVKISYGKKPNERLINWKTL